MYSILKTFLHGLGQFKTDAQADVGTVSDHVDFSVELLSKWPVLRIIGRNGYADRHGPKHPVKQQRLSVFWFSRMCSTSTHLCLMTFELDFGKQWRSDLDQTALMRTPLYTDKKRF